MELTFLTSQPTITVAGKQKRGRGDCTLLHKETKLYQSIVKQVPTNAARALIEAATTPAATEKKNNSINYQSTNVSHTSRNISQ